MAVLYQNMGAGWAVLLFLPVLAAQLVIRKYVHLELSNRELTALFQVAKRLRNSYQPETFFDQILQEARRIVDFHTGVILFWSQERQIFLPGAVRGAFKEDMSNLVLSPGEGLVGRVIETKEPLVIGNIRDDAALADEAGPFKPFRSLMVIP
ncbi:hypothetical protein N752_00430 [Desulforamulus aquiferis]|nr:GAF domain-containing protein [Desulforamulus aquiferis]RYD07081.1 hypothetical protein N752_00430 [Desulforamulus aquiferis]